MKVPIRTLPSMGGAIALLALGGLTFLELVPQVIGLPLLLVAALVYGWSFEKAFWVILLIAIGLIFLWLGYRLYPDYAGQPTVIVIYLLVAGAAIGFFARLLVVNSRNINAEAAGALQHRQEKLDREAREVVARELVAEKNIKPRPGEPLPPWIKFPGYAFFDGLERFGAYGPWEEYRDKQWGSFWSGLSINQRHEYFQYYDLGERWSQRGDWYSNWVTWERNEDWADYLEKLVEEASPETHPEEPAPPWFKYPDLADSTTDWKQGNGDTYLNQTFLPFFNALTDAAKGDYLRRYDLGLGWDDRDEWMDLIGWEKDIVR